MSWQECELYLWKVKYWGSLNLSEDSADKDQAVFVLADNVESAIAAVREFHDKHAIPTFAKRICNPLEDVSQ